MIPSHLPIAAILAASLCAAPARAENALTPEAAAAQLSAVLSLVTGGTLGAPDHPPEVTPDGDAFRVRVPLPALTEPPNAALTAHAQPLGGGVWDITSAMLPPVGAFIVAQVPNKGLPNRFAYSIGQQAITGRIDATLAQPSPFSMDLKDVAVRSENAGIQTEQKIARQTMQGVLTGEPENRMTVRAQGAATDWRISARDPRGTSRDSVIRSAASSVEIEGLDRSQLNRLRAAMQTFAGTVQAASPDMTKQTVLTDQQRTYLGSILDALQGVMGRMNIEETIEGIHIDGPADVVSDVGRVRFGMAGESRNDHLDADFDLALHDLKVSSVRPEYAAYLPTLVQLRPALAGIRTSALMRFLHHAAAGASPDTLQAEALALMNEPGARLGFENLSLSAGPLRIEGSGRMLPPANGVPGMEAHLKARGLDATVASLQSNPKAQQIVPLIFLAKGMARTEGDALIWDVAFADGAMTVNGVPLGQPAHGKPPQPTQKKRQQP